MKNYKELKVFELQHLKKVLNDPLFLLSHIEPLGVLLNNFE